MRCTRFNWQTLFFRRDEYGHASARKGALGRSLTASLTMPTGFLRDAEVYIERGSALPPKTMTEAIASKAALDTVK